MQGIEIALGYLDPGTGSMLLQVLLGGAAAVAVTGKLYWRRLKHAIRRRPLLDADARSADEHS